MMWTLQQTISDEGTSQYVMSFVLRTNDSLDFFFFQAEDGIRDLTVTGVQTCALPIWRGQALEAHARYRQRDSHGVRRHQVRVRSGEARRPSHGDGLESRAAQDEVQIGRASCRERV